MEMKTLPISLQKRDFDLLRGLFESRTMTTAHVAALYFNGSREAAKKRLQKLKAAGLIGERKRRVNEPSVLFLAGKAFPALHDHGILAEYPLFNPSALKKRSQVSETTLRHELEVADVKAAFHAAIAKTNSISIAEFTTWPLLSEFEARIPGSDEREVRVQPDGFIRIQEKGPDGSAEHTFFLEVDRSTELQETLARRARCYLHHYQSGGFAAKQGAARSAYKDYPFRVLIVLKNAERRNNTAERLVQGRPPIFTHAHLSTLDEVKSDPFGAIWMTPIDYRDVVAGTPFDTAQTQRSFVYRRQSERESLVERQIQKRKLLLP